MVLGFCGTSGEVSTNSYLVFSKPQYHCKEKISSVTEFYIVPGQAATLHGRKTSEMPVILKVGININNCTTNIDNAQLLDNKAALRIFDNIKPLVGTGIHFYYSSDDPFASHLYCDL